MQTKSKGLRAKDLITTGIFTMLYFVVILVFAMGLMALPYISLFITCFDAVVGGVIFFYLAVKIGKFGSVTIMSSVIGIIMCLVGHFWPCIIFGPAFGLLADFICSRGGHRKFNWNVLGYIVFILGLTLEGYTPMLFFVDAFRTTRAEMGLTTDMIERLIDLTHGPLMIATFAGAAVCAVIGAFIGKALLKKHFEKAGVL
jgi:energy-coupling factor transport system substrate-specific component